MKRSKKGLVTGLFLAVVLCLPIFFAVGCDLGGASDQSSISQFYDAVVESQTHLDTVADTIYSYWYDAIYKDKYSGSIDRAIAYALSDCSEDIDFVKTNETTIQALYKDVRDSELKSEVKEVMTAYGDYYEFVINVSGSFKSYSENKETYKKALATALKHLSLEL